MRALKLGGVGRSRAPAHYHFTGLVSSLAKATPPKRDATSRSCLLRSHPTLVPLKVDSSQSERYNRWKTKWLLLWLVNYICTCSTIHGRLYVRYRNSSTKTKVGECKELIDKISLLFYCSSANLYWGWANRTQSKSMIVCFLSFFVSNDCFTTVDKHVYC